MRILHSATMSILKKLMIQRHLTYGLEDETGKEN